MRHVDDGKAVLRNIFCGERLIVVGMLFHELRNGFIEVEGVELCAAAATDEMDDAVWTGFLNAIELAVECQLPVDAAALVASVWTGDESEWE